MAVALLWSATFGAPAKFWMARAELNTGKENHLEASSFTYLAPRLRWFKVWLKIGQECLNLATLCSLGFLTALKHKGCLGSYTATEGSKNDYSNKKVYGLLRLSLRIHIELIWSYFVSWRNHKWVSSGKEKWCLPIMWGLAKCLRPYVKTARGNFTSKETPKLLSAAESGFECRLLTQHMYFSHLPAIIFFFFFFFWERIKW